MSRLFLTPINLNQNQLLNAVIQNLATAPSSPATGQIYYNTVENCLFIYNGTAWTLVGGTAYGTLSSRPVAGSSNANTFYYATDNYLMYYSNGTTWQQVNGFGSGQSTTVAIAGSAADGTSTNFARADHTHAGPGFGSVVSQTTNGASSTSGTATTVAHSDHTHGTPALTSVTPSNVTATSAAVGTGTAAAHEDHVHGFTPSGFSLSAFSAPTGSLSIGGYTLTNVATPVNSTDAANKAYVDASAQGLNVKLSVAVATTGSNITLSGTQTIDGVGVTAGQRVLVKDQSTASQNGIYVVASGAWSRSADDGTPAVGDFVFVESGTTWAHTGWIVTSVSPSITWTQFSAAGEYTAGNGINITGASIALNPTSTGGLQATSGGASILLATNSGLGTSSSGLAVGAGSGIVVSTGTVAIDTTVVVRKYATSIGDGTSTSFTVTHNLGTRDVQVTLYDNSLYSEVSADITHSTTNTVTVAFSTAPSSSQYRVVVFA
jgi:hypothetical protein